MGILPIVLWIIDHEDGRFFFLGIVATIFPIFVLIIVISYKCFGSDCPISGIASWFAVIFITNILTFMAWLAINASGKRKVFINANQSKPIYYDEFFGLKNVAGVSTEYRLCGTYHDSVFES